MIVKTRSLTESLEKKYSLKESYWWEDWENLPKERTDEISKWAKNYVNEICKYDLRNYDITGPKFEDSNEKFTVIINNKIFNFDWADIWVNKAYYDENREETLPDDYEYIYDTIDDDPIGYRIINTIESVNADPKYSVDYSDGKLDEAYEVETDDELDAIMDDDTLSDEEKEAEIGRVLDKHDKLNEDVDSIDYSQGEPLNDNNLMLDWHEFYDDEYEHEWYACKDDAMNAEVVVWPTYGDCEITIYVNDKEYFSTDIYYSNIEYALDFAEDCYREEVLGESLDESLNEGNSCDGWIAFYNGKKLEIPKSDVDGGIYEAKQKAIKELKVPKSKLGLLAIKPAYNESLNEAQLNENPAIAAAARVVAPVALDLAANAISSGIDAKLHDRADNLEEDFFDPTSWFYDLVNNYETWSGAEWNSWSQEERDAAVTKAMKHFLIDNQLSEEEAEEFKRDLTDNNFHTECKIFSELYGTV